MKERIRHKILKIIAFNKYSLFKKPAVKISCIYAALGALWVIVSDHAVLFFSNSAALITRISIYKGWIFILFTTFLIYKLINKDVRKFQNTQRYIKKQQEEILKLNKELEQRVLERTNQLEDANHELETFSFTVSHDLKAPLRAIDGFSRILEEDFSDKLPDDCSYLIDIIRKNASLMMQLIDDLLAFSRMSKAQINKVVIDMDSLVVNVVEELKVQNKERSIEFCLLPLRELTGDAAMLRQVMVNLLSNAVKFTRHKEVAQIEVGCSQETNENIYYIKDNGVGFDMKYAGKLFGVFQRMHTEDEFEGHGIGLSIVQRIIHKHGGRVWIEAQPDKGTTVYYSIPC